MERMLKDESRKSKLDPHRDEIIKLYQSGTTVADIVRYMQSEHDMEVSVGAITYFIRKRSMLGTALSSSQAKTIRSISSLADINAPTLDAIEEAIKQASELIQKYVAIFGTPFEGDGIEVDPHLDPLNVMLHLHVLIGVSFKGALKHADDPQAFYVYQKAYRELLEVFQARVDGAKIASIAKIVFDFKE